MNDINNTKYIELNWLRLAMSIIVSVESSSVLSCKDKEWAAGFKTNKKSDKYRHPIGLGKHSHVEICLTLEGNFVLDFNDKLYSFNPPAIALIQPDVVHCEGYAHQNRKYSVLWFVCFGPAMVATIDSYKPQIGWTCDKRWALESSYSKSLFDMLVDKNKSVQFETVRANLIQLVSELYRRVFADFSCNERKPDLKYASILQNLCVFIDNHLNEPLTLQELSNLVRLTPNYLNSIFVKWAGESIYQYVIRRRMEKATQMLNEKGNLIKQIALQVGYQDPLYFSKAFYRYYGRWPSEIRSDF